MKIKDFEIKQTDYRTLQKIVECQKKAFPDSLSTKMGDIYLKKMLSWFIAEPNAFMHHIEENGKCLGYCGGLISDGTLKMGSASGMLQHSFFTGIVAIAIRPWLLFHPELFSKIPLIAKNILEKLSFTKKQDYDTIVDNEDNKNKEAKVGLVIIGVDPKLHSLGIGYQLLHHFEQFCFDKGYRNVYLSVNIHNKQAIHAYERNGWIKSGKNYQTYYMMKKL